MLVFPTTIVFVVLAHLHDLVNGLHTRLAETQLQDVEEAFPVVNADEFEQLKQVNVFPTTSIADTVPQSQKPFVFHVKAELVQVQLLLSELTIFVFV